MTEKKNCWEFMGCGREPRGVNVAETGICLAAIALRFDGVNGGKCAGRFCWQVAGTYCNGQRQGTFATKIQDCILCPFFLAVAREEGESLVFTK